MFSSEKDKLSLREENKDGIKFSSEFEEMRECPICGNKTLLVGHQAKMQFGCSIICLNCFYSVCDI
jgi:ribosomal protein S27AE